MEYTGQISTSKRIIAGAATLLSLGLVGFILVNGLDLRVVKSISDAISAVAIPAPQPPPPEPVAPATKPDRAAGAASEANRNAKAAAVVAPKPKLPPPNPPPIAAAPQPGTGSDASAGATPVKGPGSGAGGRGDGFGSGGRGQGTGSGGSKAVWQSGRIKDSDYPKQASRAKAGGVVETRFTIQPTGRVTDCQITLSSGDASLDAVTCQLIEKRFRFKPATNAAGTPIASIYGWRQSWWLESRR